MLVLEDIVEIARHERDVLHRGLLWLDAVAAPLVRVIDKARILRDLKDGDTISVEFRADLPEHLLQTLARILLAQGNAQASLIEASRYMSSLLSMSRSRYSLRLMDIEKR